jgi:predicted transcriptional regulator
MNKQAIIKLLKSGTRYTSTEIAELVGITERLVRKIVAEDIHSEVNPVIGHHAKTGYKIADLNNAYDRIELYKTMQENASRMRKLKAKNEIIEKALNWPDRKQYQNIINPQIVD